MHSGGSSLQTPLASPSPLSIHVEFSRFGSESPYPPLQEYVQVLLKPLLSVQDTLPFVGGVIAGVQVKAGKKKTYLLKESIKVKLIK